MIRTLSLLFLFGMSLSLQSQPIYTNGDRVGIGTQYPQSKLEIRNGIDIENLGTQFAGPYDVGWSNDYGANEPDQYLLLCPAITGGVGNSSAGMSGKLTFLRGNYGSFNFLGEYNLSIQSAYTTSTASVIPANDNSPILKIYRVDYGSVSYLAIKPSDVLGTGARITYTGFFWNNINGQKPQLVSAASVSATDFKNYQSLFSNIAFVTVDGKIGIGTTTPGNNRLAVEGTIAARKVKVTQANPWPDYVFEPNYPLMSLDSVEAYIRSHKHLPDVISAKEVVTEGVDLGDNQAVLLKKVEELTLYIIRIEKNLKEQQAQIQVLQNKLQAK